MHVSLAGKINFYCEREEGRLPAAGSTPINYYANTGVPSRPVV